MKNIKSFSPYFDGTVKKIISVQRDDGGIPWFKDGVLDPWNHLEAVMALNLCDQQESVKRGFDHLFNTQLDDGSWWGQLGSAVPLDDGQMKFSSEGMASGNRTKDTNFAAYIATAVWHDYLLNKNLDFVKTAWPHVKKAIGFSLSLQTKDGDIRWAAETETTREDDALVTGCCSIYKSLNSSLKLAELATFDCEASKLINEWTAARDRLRDALVNKPHRFDRNWQPKDNFSMDWYYPVLTGVLEGDAAQKRLDEKWDTFVIDGFGCKCVREEPWVTVAETAELVMALVKAGRETKAKEVFSWLDKYRDQDGGYWMGYQTEQKMNWPLEKPPWTSGAVILATDTVFNITPASELFSK